MRKSRLFRFFRPGAIPLDAGSQSLFAPIAPFRIAPRYVPRVWGVTNLEPWFPLHSENEPIGEVWLTGDACMISTGPHAGKQLGDLFREEPEAMLGGMKDAGSPLLIKIIFAKEKLSVQVHPDDALARRYGFDRGKTECWYALDARPGAQVAVGLRPGTSMEQVRAAVQDGTMETYLKVISIGAGEMVYVDAGTVHAIWPGSILLETQQNCDLTYRLFDYGRPRELQIEKSLEAMRLVTRAGKLTPRILADRTVLVEDEYFCVERIPINVSRSSGSLPSQHEPARGLAYLFAASGAARLTSLGFEALDLPERGIVAVPAASPVFSIQDMGGLDLIRISPRWPENASH